MAHLQCCGPSVEYCVRVWCKLVRKWPRNTPNNNIQRYAVVGIGRYAAGCVSALMGLVTLKLVCESHQRWRTFIPNLGTPLGSRVIRYVRDEQTDRRTDRQKQSLLPLPYGRGHNKITQSLYTEFCTQRLASLLSSVSASILSDIERSVIIRSCRHVSSCD